MILRSLIIVFLVLGTIGCPKKEFLTIIDLSNIEHPDLCLSSGENCTGFGIGYGDFTVAEVKEIDGKYVERICWTLISRDSYPKIKKFSYGTVPPGYTESHIAEPLKVNRIYRIGDRNYMKIYREGETYKTKIGFPEDAVMN